MFLFDRLIYNHFILPEWLNESLLSVCFSPFPFIPIYLAQGNAVKPCVYPIFENIRIQLFVFHSFHHARHKL